MAIIRKTHTSDTPGWDFLLSDATVDRYGDSIVAEGWDLKSFKLNPIALFSHESTFPIGTWRGLRVEAGALRGRLQLAPEGTSARIDELRRLVEAGILKAVSVGFRPIESEPLVKTGGTKYIKSELVECSLVSVPANPNALQISKSLGVSPETMRMVFGRQARTHTSTIQRRLPMTINERIAKARRHIASMERAKAVLEKANASIAKTTPRNVAATKRAKVVLEKVKAREQRDQIERARDVKTQPEPVGGYTIWRGEKIPNSWWYHWYRKNWWDPLS